MASKKMAIEIVSKIGALGHDLQFKSDAEITDAVKFLRTVNPDMFNWLALVLAGQHVNRARAEKGQ